jgi:CheY-like chemotaxis protein
MKNKTVAIPLAALLLSTSTLASEVIPVGSVVAALRSIKDAEKKFSFPHIATPDLPEDLEGLNVLVVEDTPIQQTIIKLKLENLGANVQVVSNTEEAGEIAEDFDVVLMDDQVFDSPRDESPRNGAGREALLEIAETDNPPPVIMHSSSELPPEFPQLQKGKAKNGDYVKGIQKMVRGLRRNNE